MLGFQKLKEDGMLKHLEKSGGIWNEKRTICSGRLPIKITNSIIKLECVFELINFSHMPATYEQVLNVKQQLSCLTFQVHWWDQDGRKTHKWGFISDDTKEDAYHAWACFNLLLQKEIPSPFEIVWFVCDNCIHFHCDLFWLYIEKYV